jgi:hypothetical protein
MTISRNTLSTLAIMSSLMLSVPALAQGGDHDRTDKSAITENQYSGSESTMVPVQPSTSYEQPGLTVERGSNNHYK